MTIQQFVDAIQSAEQRGYVPFAVVIPVAPELLAESSKTKAEIAAALQIAVEEKLMELIC